MQNVTQNKVNGENVEADTSLLKVKDIIENNEVLDTEKTLKKKVGQKGRKRHKSWVKQQPKKKKKVTSKDKTITSQVLEFILNSIIYSFTFFI